MAVAYENQDRIARIRLDDGKANAMNPEWFAAFNDALDKAESDTPGCLIIEGRAGFFSGGLDVKRLFAMQPEELSAFAFGFAQTMLRVFTLPVPTLAAMAGHAIAGGAVLSFACDRRIALDGAFKLQMNETQIGIPVPTWMHVIAASAVPAEQLARVLLLADVYSPAEAAAMGTYSVLAASESEFDAAVSAAAQKSAALNAAAYAETKRRMRADAAANALEILKTRELTAG